MNQFLDLFSILALLIFIGISISNLKNGILFGFLIRPLIDTSWDVRYFGFSLIDVFSVLFLYFSFRLISQYNLYKHLNKYLVVTWSLAHFGLILAIAFEPMVAFEGIIRMLFLPVAFLLLPFFFRTYNYKNRIGLFLLIGALFSVTITIFQGIGVISIETSRMSKGLTRANGFYHDIMTSRIYVVQGLLVLFFIFKMKLLKLPKVIFIALLIYLIIGGYFLYSKALIGIIISGIALYSITINKVGPALIFGVIFVSVFIVFQDNLQITTAQMFTKELEYNSGELQNEQELLSGRGIIWSHYLNKINESDMINFLIGFNYNDGRTHNEFLRIFILSGLIGFISYILFFIKLINITLKQFRKNHKFKFISIWCLTILIIDASGVVWGMYPHYMVLILGFYAISITKFKKITTFYKVSDH